MICDTRTYVVLVGCKFSANLWHSRTLIHTGTTTTYCSTRQGICTRARTPKALLYFYTQLFAGGGWVLGGQTPTWYNQSYTLRLRVCLRRIRVFLGRGEKARWEHLESTDPILVLVGKVSYGLTRKGEDGAWGAAAAPSAGAVYDHQGEELSRDRRRSSAGQPLFSARTTRNNGGGGGGCSSAHCVVSHSLRQKQYQQQQRSYPVLLQGECSLSTCHHHGKYQ